MLGNLSRKYDQKKEIVNRMVLKAKAGRVGGRLEFSRDKRF